MSDKGLAHAIYQSKISGVEIVILSIVEHIESKESSTVTATVKREGEFDKTRGADLEIIVEVEIKQIIEDKNKTVQRSWSYKSVLYFAICCKELMHIP